MKLDRLTHILFLENISRTFWDKNEIKTQKILYIFLWRERDLFSSRVLFKNIKLTSKYCGNFERCRKCEAHGSGALFKCSIWKNPLTNANLGVNEIFDVGTCDVFQIWRFSMERMKFVTWWLWRRWIRSNYQRWLRRKCFRWKTSVTSLYSLKLKRKLL